MKGEEQQGHPSPAGQHPTVEDAATDAGLRPCGRRGQRRPGLAQSVRPGVPPPRVWDLGPGFCRSAPAQGSAFQRLPHGLKHLAFNPSGT